MAGRHLSCPSLALHHIDPSNTHHGPLSTLLSFPSWKACWRCPWKKYIYKELSLLLPFYPSPAPACLCTGRLLLLVVLSLHLGRVGAPLFISCYTAHTLLMGSWLLPVLVRVEIPPDASKREGRGVIIHPPAQMSIHTGLCVCRARSLGEFLYDRHTQSKMDEPKGLSFDDFPALLNPKRQQLLLRAVSLKWRTRKKQNCDAPLLLCAKTTSSRRLIRIYQTPATPQVASRTLPPFGRKDIFFFGVCGVEQPDSLAQLVNPR